MFDKETINLAVGDIQIDEKTGKEKVTWSVMAPSSVDKGLNEARFQLPGLALAYVNATTAPPTTGEPPK